MQVAVIIRELQVAIVEVSLGETYTSTVVASRCFYSE